MLKKIFGGILLIFISLIIIQKLAWIIEPSLPHTHEKLDFPVFKELNINFSHKYNKNKSLPFMGGAVFDKKGDGQQYLIIGGGFNQPDHLFKYTPSGMIDITQKSGLTKPPHDTTYGIAAIDANEDGIVDLFIARESGVYLYIDHNGIYKGTKLDIPLSPQLAPISIAIADLKKRGKVDLFITTSPKKIHLGKSHPINGQKALAKGILLLNNGNNTFTDITEQSGLANAPTALQAVFVDIEERGEIDLIMTNSTGSIGIFKNLGNLKFEEVIHPLSSTLSFPMGIAVGDYNNDGRPDFFFSNIGAFDWWNIGIALPDALIKKDFKKNYPLLRSHILLRNEGQFNFSNAAQETKVADYEFGLGAIFADLTNKGRLDLILVQNDIEFLPHRLLRLPGRYFFQLSDQTFSPSEKQTGIVNPFYGSSPLITDFNGSGYPDLIYLNLNGPARGFLNQGKNNNYVKVTLKNEPQSLGAKVSLKTKQGKDLSGFYIPTQGLCTSQTNSLFFGLGQETELEWIKIRFIDGHQHFIHHPAINQEIKVQR